MSTKMWQEAPLSTRIAYRIVRHPLTMLSAYVTMFFFSISLQPLLKNPAKHWDAGLSLLGHGGLITLLWLTGGFWVVFFVIFLPMTIASAFGGYLFFAQHSFEDMKIVSPDSWSYHQASLDSSSYLRLGKIMHWFTGNIGYHHIHHLNVRIPFYRLPETMAAIRELQSPRTTSLSPRDIYACFQSCLWDEDQQRMVSFRQAGRSGKAM